MSITSAMALFVGQLVGAGLERPAAVDAEVPLPDEVAGDDPLGGQQLADVVGGGALGDHERLRLARLPGRVELALDPERQPRRPAIAKTSSSTTDHGEEAPAARRRAPHARRSRARRPARSRRRRTRRRSRRRRSRRRGARRRQVVRSRRRGRRAPSGSSGRGRGAVGHRSGSSGVRARRRWSSQACSMTAAATLSTTRRRALASRSRAMQVAVGGHGGEPLVPQLDRQARGGGQLVGLGAGGGGGRPVGAVERQRAGPTTRQLGTGLLGQRGDGAVVAGPVAGAGDHLVGRGHRAVGGGQRDPDALGCPGRARVPSRAVDAGRRPHAVEGGVDAVGVLAAGDREERVLAAAALDRASWPPRAARTRRGRCRG